LSRAVHGLVLLDKPAGLSSNQALQRVKRLFDSRKAGHTGSLDPFATGMLPVCLGEATKTSGHMLESNKCYRATAHLGQATATGDPEGEVVESCEVPDVAESAILEALQAFLGETEQVPPMYSALKHQGRPLYELAREGLSVERKARRIFIHRLDVVAWRSPDLEFEVLCSKGTYVRSLAMDIAGRLGSCAHLTALRRLYVEPFAGRQMHDVAALEAMAAGGRLESVLLPLDAGLAGWPVVRLEGQQARGFSHGNPVPAPGDGPVRVYTGERPLGLGECRDGLLRPRRLFVLEGEPGSSGGTSA